MFRNWSLCLWPVAKSLGSCAGVIFTAPVPKLMSTSSASVMMGIFLPSSGCLYLHTAGKNHRRAVRYPTILCRWRRAASSSHKAGQIEKLAKRIGSLYANAVRTPNSTSSVYPGTFIFVNAGTST
eukprot:jgi/Botrbrau1/20723/Bobra.0058s0052.1